MRLLQGRTATSAATVLVLVALAFIPTPPANAIWGPGGQLASVGTEQANDSTSVAVLSKDGRYVAFQTTARNLFPPEVTDPPGFIRQGGIFRKDMVTGVLDYVAGGTLAPQAGGATTLGAQWPAISADGRYVTFQTREALSASDTNTNIDVYRRDMGAAFDDPAAYVLVSAKDQSDEPPAYSTGPIAGSVALAREGISADGQRVLFRTAALSDIAGPNTPPTNLFVRDIAARTTTLVTAGAADGLPVGGAAGAALSADGTTVAWTNSGETAALQASFMPGDPPQEVRSYYLWRRIGDPAGARRITGWTDPDDPGCTADMLPVPSSQVATGPCYGPLAGGEDFLSAALSSLTPSLSTDGYRVAFLTDSAPRDPDALNNRRLDLFVTDMSPEVTRKAGTIELTREGGTDADNISGAIDNISISGDGRRVSFVTRRSTFILPSPRLIDPEIINIGPLNVYQVDLSTMRMERLTTSYTGGEVDGTSLEWVSSSADGRRVAFVSGTSNLAAGDGNGVNDAFVVTEPPRGDAAATNEPPFNPPRAPAVHSSRSRLLRVQSVRSRRGQVRLTVGAPGAGLVRAQARERRGSTGSRRQLRLVARSAKRFARAGTATLVLRPARRFGKVIRKRGLPATIRVSFTPAAGGPPVTVNKPAVFRR